MLKHRMQIYALVFCLLIAGVIAQAQEVQPAIAADNQFVFNNTVTVQSVVSDGPGYIVIHADNGNAAPGAVIGYRHVHAGSNSNVVVPLDSVNVTPLLFAMLHTDTGEVGVYEFGTVDGADTPVMAGESPLSVAIMVELISIPDQIVGDSGMVTADVISTQQDGWLVIHADDGSGAPGGVLGQTFVPAGTSLGVSVPIEGEVTNALYPMLHVDTGQAEVYEFGSVEGADMPVRINEHTAVTSILTVPTIRVYDQIVIGSDATASSDGSMATLNIASVLSDGNGWIVIHAADETGNPGKVIGYGAVQDGWNNHVVVELNPEDVTPVVFPMLHEDSGEALVYEFGTVDGADVPVRVNDQIVVVPVDVAPTIRYEGSLRGNQLTIASALIDGPGWLVIHADDGNGAVGEVIGYSPLITGANTNIVIELDEMKITGTLFPMLHYDNGEVGAYEFGTVDGADGPVIVNGNVVVGPLNPAVYDE